jgi:uncharacterized protein
MPLTRFLIFLSIVFLVYGSASYYIYVRGRAAIPPGSSLQGFFPFLFWALAASYLTGRLLQNVTMSWPSDGLIWIGALWLAVTVYSLLSILVIDLFRLLNRLIPFFPSFITTHPQRAASVTGAVVFGLVLLVVIAGHINSRYPRIRSLQVTIPDHAQLTSKNHSIVLVSDIHLGTIVSARRLGRLVSHINDLSPDLVLLAGDIIDENLRPVLREDIGDQLRRINSRLGVVAITGNHEYIGGVEEAVRYLEEHDVLVLRDQVAKLGDLYVVGREDISIRWFAGQERKPLQELMAQVEPGYPVILMDHQPLGLEEAEDHGVDLQLSGHTHHGQLWPFHLITQAIYEQDWGYLRRGATQYYISCGAGTWGPPVRTTSRPEIVKITLVAEAQNNGQ